MNQNINFLFASEILFGMICVHFVSICLRASRTVPQVSLCWYNSLFQGWLILPWSKRTTKPRDRRPWCIIEWWWWWEWVGWVKGCHFYTLCTIFVFGCVNKSWKLKTDLSLSCVVNLKAGSCFHYQWWRFTFTFDLFSNQKVHVKISMLICIHKITHECIWNT